MTKQLQHWFALSEKGARDLVKAVFWCFVCNLALMLPVGAVLFAARHLLQCLETGGSPLEGFWIYTGFGLAVVVLRAALKKLPGGPDLETPAESAAPLEGASRE